jgi:hypothetical protein
MLKKPLLQTLYDIMKSYPKAHYWSTETTSWSIPISEVIQEFKWDLEKEKGERSEIYEAWTKNNYWIEQDSNTVNVWHEDLDGRPVEMLNFLKTEEKPRRVNNYYQRKD